MTDHSPNDQFHASSFLQGANAEYVEQLYARFANDPGAVDATWAAFFRSLGDTETDVRREAQGASWDRADWPPVPTDDLTAALTGEWPVAAKEMKGAGDKIKAKAAEAGVAVSDDQIKRAVLDRIRALMIIRAYRIRGHLVADLDPLGMRAKNRIRSLIRAPTAFRRPTWTGRSSSTRCSASNMPRCAQILDIVKRTYCGTFALQYMHISDPEQAGWLKERIEGFGKEIQFTREGRKAILNKLVEAEGFEKFLHVKYMGTKRFGLDGGEALIPAMEQIVKRGGNLGVRDIVIGMPHRGRLSVLANVMAKPYRAIFNEFQGGSFKPEDVDGSGDVKYHLGASSDRNFDGNTVHLSLTANPSHLEAVNPVVLGKVRAKQAQMNDTDRTRVLPILLHGDAAFAGQGVVAECFGLSGLVGHRTGGTIHIIVNNQIGFTTAPHFSRSSPLSDRHRPDGRGADLPRQRRRSRGRGPRRQGRHRVSPEVPQGRGHRHLLLPPLRSQRRRRADVHQPGDVQDHQDPQDHAPALHRTAGQGRSDPGRRDRGHEGRLPGASERGIRDRQELQAEQGRLARRPLVAHEPRGRRIHARQDRDHQEADDRNRRRADPRARRLRPPQDCRAPDRDQGADVQVRPGFRLGHRRGAGLRQPR